MPLKFRPTGLEIDKGRPDYRKRSGNGVGWGSRLARAAINVVLTGRRSKNPQGPGKPALPQRPADTLVSAKPMRTVNMTKPSVSQMTVQSYSRARPSAVRNVI